jgi:hypothetical protein
VYLVDELANALEIGDNLGVNVDKGNDEGVSFWLILCAMSLHKVTKTFIDNWGTSFEDGDDVIGGKY